MEGRKEGQNSVDPNIDYLTFKSTFKSEKPKILDKIIFNEDNFQR